MTALHECFLGNMEMKMEVLGEESGASQSPSTSGCILPARSAFFSFLSFPGKLCWSRQSCHLELRKAAIPTGILF